MAKYEMLVKVTMDLGVGVRLEAAPEALQNLAEDTVGAMNFRSDEILSTLANGEGYQGTGARRRWQLEDVGFDLAEVLRDQG